MAMMGAVMSVVGGIVQAQGALQQAEAEAKAHEYNAAVDERNIGVIEEQTVSALKYQQISDVRQLNAIRSRYASVGITMTGSAADVWADTNTELAYGRTIIRYQGELKKVELTDDKNLELMSADNARKAGKISATSAILGGLTSAIGSVGSMMS